MTDSRFVDRTRAQTEHNEKLLKLLNGMLEKLEARDQSMASASA